MTLSAVIQREDDMFVALCPELDVVSQGYTSDEAYANLQEAVELLLEDVSAEELERRLSNHMTVQKFEVTIPARRVSF